MNYLLRRAATTFVVLFGLSIVVFALVRLTGDPTYLLLPVDARREDIQAYRSVLGLNHPWYTQYFAFVGGALRGNLGNSFRHRQPAMGLMLERVPATLRLAGAALFLSMAFPMVLGTVAAVRRNSWADAALRVLAISLQALPTFWLGIMLIVLVSVRLQWLPAAGAGSPRHLILPAITLSAYFIGTNTRLVRSSLLEVLKQDYVRTARAKGLAAPRVLLKHAWTNAAIPFLTILGLQLGALFGGAIITETVFAYPGMGLLAVTSIIGRDFPVVQVFVLFTGVAIVLTNLTVDILYSMIDPRIRYSG